MNQSNSRKIKLSTISNSYLYGSSLVSPLPRLLEQLRVARGDGSYQKRLTQLAKIDLQILDDFGLKPLSQAERHDLLEVIEDRTAPHSTLIISQLPIAHWHQYLGQDDPTVADALLDRLLSQAHRLEWKGETMRRQQQEE